MTALNKQALTAERMEWLKKLADAEYCKNNPGHWLMSLNETNLLATLALSSVELGVSLEAEEKRIAELQIARDKCFLSGLKTGWEYGIADDTEGYNREIADAQAVIDSTAGIGVKGD
ncbi:hypothetical protein [Citrobacter sp. Cf042]|uniref:hypothetical protein n=1 Tax=Citrobacter sp. Cf042 TaxID=2985045 RepID=UPI002581F66B|nr:hypothetical protein [Citrobacter sp. Cf042]MDM3285031.1 hypothetical protein [Citrobacter sp. Cf042]